MSFEEEYFGKTTVYDKRITIPKDAREYFHIKNGDRFVWMSNRHGDLVLRQSKTNKMKGRFKSL